MDDEKIDICKYSEIGLCTYYEDSELNCKGTEKECDKCAVYVGYSSELN